MNFKIRHQLFIFLWLFSSLLFISCSSDNEPIPNPPEENIIRPPYLQSGDSIGVVAISSAILDTPERADSLINEMQKWGLKIKKGKHLFDHSGGLFPASDEDRAQDLQEMLENDNLKAVVFYRGGYGSIRTLNYLDLSVLRTHPKWLVGFSDLTVIHYALRNLKVESIHGAMPSTFSSDERSKSSLRNALFGDLKQYVLPPHEYNKYGTTSGYLVGGNLAMINSINGTYFDINLSNEPYIMLIEEVGEKMYSIDRLMQTLLKSGKLNQIKGLLLGHFSDTTGEDVWGSPVYKLLKQYADLLNIPIAFDVPAGHIDPNYSFYMGRKISLTVDAQGTIITF